MGSHCPWNHRSILELSPVYGAPVEGQSGPDERAVPPREGAVLPVIEVHDLMMPQNVVRDCQGRLAHEESDSAVLVGESACALAARIC